MKEAHTQNSAACSAQKPLAQVSSMYDHQTKNDPAGRAGSKPTRPGSGRRIQEKGQDAIADNPGSVGVGPISDRLITAEELAPRLGFSVRKVWEYSRKGKLPTVRFNKRDIRFHWPSVLQQLSRNQ